MKVLILGGYGEFGGRLARLLLRDGHEVLVAGRSEAAAKSFCAEHGGTPVQIDIDRDLDSIADRAPDAVVDAVGPFQSYGKNPYRVARSALAARANYLDLSDDARFTTGISELDELANSVGRFALSGASSAPALSSAAVEALRTELSEISVIETAILPGSRAPRGRSVMASVLGQAGNPLRVWRGGVWRKVPAWSESKPVELGSGIVRSASWIGAPDLELFPDFFNARSVLFRAGLQPVLMHRSLSALAFLRRLGLLPNLRRFVGPLRAIARVLEPFGSDRGGMVVEVTGRLGNSGNFEMHRWTLLAESGEGPYVPAVPVRAILRNPERIPPGARPCLAELPLQEFEAAMTDIGVQSSRSAHPRPPLFQAALGEKWHQLPVEVQMLHSIQDCESFSGRAEVTRGNSLLARVAAALFRFPVAGKEVPMTITMTRTPSGETWERNFNGRRFRSYLTPAGPDHYRERFLVFNYEQELPVGDGYMELPVRRGWVLGLPLPRRLLAGSDSREYSNDGKFHFDVNLLAPVTGELIVRYRGWVEPDEG